MQKKNITVITGSRPDYSAIKHILKLINLEKKLKLNLVVTGSHLFKENKNLINFIKKDKIKIHEKIKILTKNYSEESISKSIGLGVKKFSHYYSNNRPDLILVMGDRFEIYASVIAALPFNIPVAHIHGGEITEGAFDDAIRHSITKLSHLHFVSNKLHAQRVKQLGEETWRINITGSPIIDTFKRNKMKSINYLKKKYSFKINKKLILVTFHPVTLESNKTKYYILEVLKALKKFDYSIIFTSPNQDTNSNIIKSEILKFTNKNGNAYFVNNFGSEDYLSILRYVSIMVGNSSSGLIEAPSFKLPVVNIGNRQGGRLREKNVINVKCTSKDIIKGILKGVNSSFRTTLKNIKNPYGDGNASMRIVKLIKNINTSNQKIINKKFIDYDIK
tara:strand:- start:3735 stop:4904 length:1170 start_codon:yes stop_codon:yes gene_type:complete